MPGTVGQPLWPGEVEASRRSSQRMARARVRRFLRSDDRGTDPLLYHPAKLRDRPPCHAGADLPGIGTVCSGVVFNSRPKLFAIDTRPRLTPKMLKSENVQKLKSFLARETTNAFSHFHFFPFSLFNLFHFCPGTHKTIAECVEQLTDRSLKTNRASGTHKMWRSENV